VPSSSDALLKPGQVIGKCRILRELGHGGMGAVFLAEHTTLGIQVALKILPPHVMIQNPTYADRFLREARVAAALRHPNVVAIMDADSDPGTGLFYIVEEFVDGGTLWDKLRKGPFSEKQALAAAAAVLRALQAAAKQNIVHRDIKPENILLTKDGRIKLGDLGLAKQLSGKDLSLTQSSTAMGTPYYMSPEQCEDARRVDARSDLYSLGATVYHLLTGQPPFSGPEMLGVIAKVMNAPVPDPRAIRPDLSAAGARFVMKLMAKDPADRYASATEALAALSKGAPEESLELAPMAAAAVPGTAAPLKAESAVSHSDGPARGGVPLSLPGPAGSGNRAAWIVAGACILLLLFAIRLMWKSGRTAHVEAVAGPDRKEPEPPPPDPDPGPKPPPDPGPKPPPDPGPKPPPDPGPRPPPDPVEPARKPFPLARGCVLALSFEPETARTHGERRGWTDRSGRGAHGEAFDAESGEGRIGRGLVFNGTTTRVTLPALPQRTVMAWIRTNGARNMTWYDGGSTARYEGFALGLGRIQNVPAGVRPDHAFAHFIDMGYRVHCDAIFEEWHHFAWIWDGETSLRILIDGRAPMWVSATPPPRPPPGERPRPPDPKEQPVALEAKPAPRAENVQLGGPRRVVGDFQPFAGTLDEVAVWERALSEEEIRELAGMAAAGNSYVEEIAAENEAK
jgi:hypothetical protein